MSIAANLDQVSQDVTAVSGSLRNAAEKADAALERIEAASGQIGDATSRIRDRYQELDLASIELGARVGEISEHMEAFNQLAELLDTPELSQLLERIQR